MDRWMVTKPQTLLQYMKLELVFSNFTKSMVSVILGEIIIEREKWVVMKADLGFAKLEVLRLEFNVRRLKNIKHT